MRLSQIHRNFCCSPKMLNKHEAAESKRKQFSLEDESLKHHKQFTQDVVKSRCGTCRNYFQDELDVLTHSLTHCDDLGTDNMGTR